MFQRAAKRPARIKLCVEKADASFDTATPSIQEFLFSGRIFNMPIAACVRRDRDFFLGKLGTFLGFRPISIVSEKVSFKISFEKSIKAVDIMAVAGELDYKRNASFGSKNQMLANAVKPAFQRGAVSFSGESAESFLFAGSNGTADIDGMGINDEKGGCPSPSVSTKDFERRSMSGVRIARRSAQLGRLKRRGNN